MKPQMTTDEHGYFKQDLSGDLSLSVCICGFSAL